MTKLRRARDLEARLVEWGREYGGGKYEFTGFGDSPMASMVKWGGRPPTGMGFVASSTGADEVQEAIEALARQPSGWLPAQVIRCEYLTPAQPNEAKRQKLRKIGHNVDRVRYYQHLRIATIHVAGWLRLPFSEGDEASLTSVGCGV